MNDFSDLLEKLPAGANIYDFLSKTVDDLVSTNTSQERASSPGR